MRYLGSKTSTLPQLDHEIRSRVASGSFCDPFGGVGTVGAHFKRRGFSVHTGDILAVANAFQTARVAIDAPPSAPPALTRETGAQEAEEVVTILNETEPVSSWVHREFSVERQFFTPANARKIDAIRRTIDRWNRNHLLNPTMLSYLRACLIDATDRVANTAGTYYAHLKHWNRKALKPFELRTLAATHGNQPCRASLQQAVDLVAGEYYDVVYLDPPYNRRDYAAYYHLPETIATGRRPRPTGLSGVDAATRPQSAFTKPSQAADAMEELVHTAKCQLLVIHYSDDGIVPPDRIRSMLRSLGDTTERSIHALGYGTGERRHVRHRLYLVRP